LDTLEKETKTRRMILTLIVLATVTFALNTPALGSLVNQILNWFQV
jgi:hypothetical protein